MVKDGSGWEKEKKKRRWFSLHCHWFSNHIIQRNIIFKNIALKIYYFAKIDMKIWI